MRKLCLLLALLSVIPIFAFGGPANSGTPNTWERLADVNIKRYGVAVAAGADGKIYAFGGTEHPSNPSEAYNRATVYDPATNVWTEIARMPVGRSGADAVLGGDGRIYVLGGEMTATGTAGDLKTVSAYNPVTGAWAAPGEVPSMAKPRFPAAVSDELGRIYAVGGNWESNNAATATIERFDPARPADGWTDLGPINGESLSGHEATRAGDGRIYVMGGGPGGNFGSKVTAYDPSTETWLPSCSQLPCADGTVPPLPTGRNGLAAATDAGGRIYSIGGSHLNNATNPDGSPASTMDVYRYTPGDANWVEVPDMPGGRLAEAARGGDDRIYAVSVTPGIAETYAYTPPVLPVPPPAPGGVTATAGDRRVHLAWTTPAQSSEAPVTGYKIYRGTQSGQAKNEVAQIPPDPPSYLDAAVANGTTYFYAVTALNSVGESPPSQEVSAVPVVPPPPPPPPDGSYLEFPIVEPNTDAWMFPLEHTADNMLWFTSRGGFGAPTDGTKITRMSETGQAQQFRVPVVRNDCGSQGDPDPRQECVRKDPGTVDISALAAAPARAGQEADLWYTDRVGDSYIGRISPQADFSGFILPSGSGCWQNRNACGSIPGEIAPASDGNMWFTVGSNDGSGKGKIGRFTPDADVEEAKSSVVEFSIPGTSGLNSSSAYHGISDGPTQITDPARSYIWFYDDDTSTARIGRLRKDTAATAQPQFEFINLPGPGVADLAAGKNYMWYLRSPTQPALYVRSGNVVGRISPDGTVTEFPIPAGYGNARHIVGAPDGYMYFTENGNTIGRIDDGGEIYVADLPTPEREPNFITVGSDGFLYFTEDYGCADCTGPEYCAGFGCMGPEHAKKIGRLSTANFHPPITPPAPEPPDACHRGPGTAAIPNQWRAIAPLCVAMKPLAVQGKDGKIYAIGGNGERVQVLDPAAPDDPWKLVAGSEPSRLSGSASIAAGGDGRIYVLGGMNDRRVPVSTVEAYDPATNQWSSISPMHAGRVGASAATDSNGHILVFGGNSGQRTMETYDPATNQWSDPEDIPDWGDDIAFAHPDGRFFLLNGGGRDQVYDPSLSAEQRWSQITGAPVSPLGAAVQPDGKIYVVGLGRIDQTLKQHPQTFAYDPHATGALQDTWVKVDAPMPVESCVQDTTCRGPAVVGGRDGTLYAVGGGTFDPIKKVFALVPQFVDNSALCTEDWTPVSAAPATAEWTQEAPLSAGRTYPVSATGPDGCIYVVSEQENPVMQAYNPRTGQWKLISLLNSRGALAMTKGPDDKLYILTSDQTVISYDPKTGRWTSPGFFPPAPTPRARTPINDAGPLMFSAAGPDGVARVYVMGGVRASQNPRVDALDPASGKWTQFGQDLSADSQGGAFGPDGRAYFVGAEAEEAKSYNPAADSWAAEAPIPTSKHTYSIVGGPDGIYALGGCTTSCFTEGNRVATVQVYDICTKKWGPVKPMLMALTNMTGVTGPDGKIYAIGGKPSGNTGDWTDFVQAYSPSAATRRLSIGDVVVVEPESGDTQATFRLSLSAPGCAPVDVSFATEDGTAKNPADYEAKSGNVRFDAATPDPSSPYAMLPGETKKDIKVTIKADAEEEEPEIFKLKITSAGGASVVKGEGTATIYEVLPDQVIPPTPGTPSQYEMRDLTEPVFENHASLLEIGTPFQIPNTLVSTFTAPAVSPATAANAQAQAQSQAQSHVANQTQLQSQAGMMSQHQREAEKARAFGSDAGSQVLMASARRHSNIPAAASVLWLGGLLGFGMVLARKHKRTRALEFGVVTVNYSSRGKTKYGR